MIRTVLFLIMIMAVPGFVLTICMLVLQPAPVQIILYESAVNGNVDVFVMNEDGTGKNNLTERDGYDGSPGWSPNGLQIVFVSDRDGDKRNFYHEC